MDRDELKNNALALLAKSKIPSKFSISNSYMLNELRRYRNNYSAVKNRTEEENQILEELEKALIIESSKPYKLPEIDNSYSETQHFISFSNDSHNYDDER